VGGGGGGVGGGGGWGGGGGGVGKNGEVHLSWASYHSGEKLKERWTLGR